MPPTSVTFTPPWFQAGQIYAGIDYRGRLSPDGKSIEGVWTQGKRADPLTLVLATAETLWQPDGPPPPAPMPAGADPAFEVATIRPTPPEGSPVIFNLRARKFTSKGTSATELIKIAYNVRGRQVLGAPQWAREIKFDVVAEPDTEGLPSEAQTRRMVRKLLADRVHLVAHTGEQVFPVLAVTVEKHSPALQPSDPKFNGQGGTFRRQAADGQLEFQFAGTTIPQFIGTIMNFFQDRQLVDETGLTGLFDITLTVPATVFNGPPGAEDDRGPALIRAAQAAGFRLRPKKEPLPIVVVDRIDKPSDNSRGCPVHEVFVKIALRSGDPIRYART